MATNLYPLDTKINGIGIYRDVSGTEQVGAGVTGVVDTAASGTNIQWTRTAGGEALEWITGRSPVGGWTLAGTLTVARFWGMESNMSANAGPRLRYYKRTAAGVETEIASSPADDGVEFITSNAEHTWSETPTSTAFAENDRFVVKFFITNIGTMAAGHTCTMRFAGAFNTFSADTFVQLTEDVTFKAEQSTTAPPRFRPSTRFLRRI